MASEPLFLPSKAQEREGSSLCVPGVVGRTRSQNGSTEDQVSQRWVDKPDWSRGESLSKDSHSYQRWSDAEHSHQPVVGGGRPSSRAACREALGRAPDRWETI